MQICFDVIRFYTSSHDMLPIVGGVYDFLTVWYFRLKITLKSKSASFTGTSWKQPVKSSASWDTGLALQPLVPSKLNYYRLPLKYKTILIIDL